MQFPILLGSVREPTANQGQPWQALVGLPGRFGRAHLLDTGIIRRTHLDSTQLGNASVRLTIEMPSSTVATLSDPVVLAAAHDLFDRTNREMLAKLRNEMNVPESADADAESEFLQMELHFKGIFLPVFLENFRHLLRSKAGRPSLSKTLEAMSARMLEMAKHLALAAPELSQSATVTGCRPLSQELEL